jgi:hypothetical protein
MSQDRFGDPKRGFIASKPMAWQRESLNGENTTEKLLIERLFWS